MSAITFEEMLKDIKRQGVTLTKSEASMKWLQGYGQQLAGGKTRDKKSKGLVTAGELMAAEKGNLSTKFKLGRMYMFFYDPKFKETLPYYDRFPCIFPLNAKDGVHGVKGFLGLNLHYLPPDLRAKMMDELWKVENNARLTKNKKLVLTYGLLQGLSNYWKPCLKHYLNPHVRSRFLEVPYEAWELALTLPLAQFEKKSSVAVWQESRKMI